MFTRVQHTIIKPRPFCVFLLTESSPPASVVFYPTICPSRLSASGYALRVVGDLAYQASRRGGHLAIPRGLAAQPRS